MNVDELLDENRALRERVATLQAHIHAGINCGFFCVNLFSGLIRDILNWRILWDILLRHCVL